MTEEKIPKLLVMRSGSNNWKVGPKDPGEKSVIQNQELSDDDDMPEYEKERLKNIAERQELFRRMKVCFRIYQIEMNIECFKLFLSFSFKTSFSAARKCR